MEMEYMYAGGESPSYAGRISGRKTMTRSGIGFDVRNLGYRYDAMGRLAEATMRQGASVLPWKPGFPSLGVAAMASDTVSLGELPWNPTKPLLLSADNSESFTYDLNANVLTVSRKGRDDAGKYRVVDEIEMGYVGNQLSWLRDDAEDALLESSMDVPEGLYSGYDIMYDGAGRVTRDVSRGIAHVNYNMTGTPWVVGMMTGDCAVYGYTSSGVKLGETIYNGSVTTRREYVGPCEYVDGKLERVNVPQGYIDTLGVLHAYIRDIQGNVAGVYEAKAGKKLLEQVNEYYAYGELTADSRGQDRNRYKHTGKELVNDLGINSYDFTARWQYPMAGAFTSPDALAREMPWLSPYAFCGGDPINLSDPTGLSTEVELLEDGTYKVVGGNLDDNDLNIYVVTKDENNNNIRGESIGQTLTLTSFYDTDNSQWRTDAIIDLSDNSGQEFLTDLITSDPDVATYASQAYGGQKYDFKVTNGDGSSYEKKQYYRGMPIKTADGRSVIASARDIGNYAAGYVAGKNGINWSLARVGFDALESIQKGSYAKEGMSSQYAQFEGWTDGKGSVGVVQRSVNFTRFPFSSIIKSNIDNVMNRIGTKLRNIVK